MGTMTLIPSPRDTVGGQFSFLTMQAANGFPLTLTNHQEEELTTPGVDGRRWRTVFDQATPFILETMTDAATYSGAIDLAEKYHRARGRLVNVILTMGNTQRSYSRLHVLDVVPRTSPGRTVGAGVTASALAVVYATWTLVGT